MEIKISDYFSDEEVSSLNKAATYSEKAGKLTHSAVDILHGKQLLDLFVPRRYGGLQHDLPSALPWLEATSWIHGSLGWTLTLASGAGLFGAFLDPDFAKSIFDKNNTFIAGSGFPGGKAEKNNTGFQVNGTWKYASGIDHATLVTATCYISKNGEVLYKDSEPITKAVAFYPDEININHKWNSMGLKATGSHNFHTRDAQIPKERVFSISSDAAQVTGPLYQYPFETFAHCTLAISFLGIARRFFDEAKDLLQSKNDVTKFNEVPTSLQKKFGKFQIQFKKTKEALYQTVDTSWQKLKKSNSLDSKYIREASIQSRRSCKIALDSVHNIYPLLGMSVINPETVINRCWRDLHTASQHLFLRPQ